jgi:HSP20 family protein
MSKLDRWLPFRFHRTNELANRQAAPLQQLVQGFFNDPFFGEPFGHSDGLERWFGDFSPKRYSPSVEVADDGKAMKVTAELPGMSREDINLQIDGNTLLISGEKKNEQQRKDDGVYRTERYCGYFQRAIPLPEEVDKENADAEFSNGVLTVRLPKLETPKTRGRQIEVKG